MKSFGFAFLALLTFAACSKDKPAGQVKSDTTAAATGTPQAIPPPTATSVQMQYSGKLGDNLGIMMRLQKDGEKLNGAYFYQTVGEDIRLSGQIGSESDVVLNEFDPKGNQTGVFKGKLLGETIEGAWSKPDGSRQMPFSITVMPATAGGGRTYSLATKAMNEENTEKRYSLRVDYPVMSGYGDAYIQAKFNARLHGAAAKLFSEYKKEYSENAVSDPEFLKNVGPDMKSELECKHTVVFKSAEFVVVVLEQYYYSLGAAHPNTDVQTVNFDLRTGRTLALQDLFRPGTTYLEVLASHAKIGIEKHMKELAGDNGGDEFQPEVPATQETFQNFAITKSGLHLYLGEIMSHAAGPQEADVPYPAIKSMIDPNGPLGVFVQ